MSCRQAVGMSYRYAAAIFRWSMAARIGGDRGGRPRLNHRPRKLGRPRKPGRPGRRGRAGRPGRRERGRGQREIHPFLDQAGHVVAGHHDLVDLPVDFPVAQLRGLRGVPPQVGDVQPVAEVIEHQAGLAPVLPGRP